MTKILVVGDSYTFGAGLKFEKDDPSLWVNQLIQKTFKTYSLTNIAEVGRNNQWIFNETAHKIVQEDFDLVIVGWSELSRYNIDVGLELYHTVSMLRDLDININPNITISGKWLKETGDRLRRVYNDHWPILDLVKYVNILKNIQINFRNKKIFFVNGLIRWSDNYFNQKEFSLPSELSSFQQQILQVETRDDDEIKKLYDLTHQHYKKYGGINEDLWLNLYQPLGKLSIDQISDTDRHPGYASQDIFVKELLPVLNERM